MSEVQNITVQVRPLAVSDMPLLHGWLNQPHLRPFYEREPSTLEQVAERYVCRVSGDHPTHCLIAEQEGTPFGYLQWYLNQSFPDYGRDTIGLTAGVSFDYYIGNPAVLGQRLGSAMLTAAIDHVKPLVSPEDRLFCVGHRPENTSAIRCSQLAGFRYLKNFIEEELPHQLYVRDER
ncbi:aminoglycoside 6'-N-acetyltransferase [Pseudovibrio sp. FO-BEG1]|uniref:GNAT family N-acetyltransferase n=1 Tax=Pseudovibrio sp. (strain FO-BEG1) TaxID=911045 RepID=UPI000238C52D|nr:GNAT family N-acetyltransferase [Pseudovibrio sp. FO-BEG1]AEV34871.1 aminoglycoside 6'-N-acetyltransferase [Pseudovibrio sp. FO-BEG1]